MQTESPEPRGFHQTDLSETRDQVLFLVVNSDQFLAHSTYSVDLGQVSHREEEEGQPAGPGLVEQSEAPRVQIVWRSMHESESRVPLNSAL